MSILSQWLGLSEDTNDMAGRAASPINTAKINAYVQQLKLAVRDKSAFDRIYSAIDSDKCLSAAELVAVAQGFAGGSVPKTRKAALLAIGQERMRVSHAKAKGESAAKSRVW